MKFKQPLSLQEVAALIGAKAIGPISTRIFGINEIHLVGPGDLAFVDHPKYYEKTLNSQASVVIIDKEVPCPEGKCLLVHPTPFDAFNQMAKLLLHQLESDQDPAPKVAPSAMVMPGVYLGKFVQIGAHSVIHPGVVIYDHCVIGDCVTIHANTVIGSDAFYFKRKQTHHEKLLSIGRVVIENHVEIGAGCTIDRGTTGETTIGEGSKLDNQIHVGHDTKIGKQCLFAAQVGIAGCVTIGDKVVMWGQVGCAANVSIGDGAVIYAQSGIAKSISAGQTFFGSPAKEAKLKMREIAALADLAKRL